MPHSFLLLHLYIWVRKWLLNIFSNISYLYDWLWSSYPLSIPLRYGTTYLKNLLLMIQLKCQFLLGTVQQDFLRYDRNWGAWDKVSIPLRYGTTAVFSCYYWYSIIFFSEIQPFLFQKVRRPIFLPDTYYFHIIQYFQTFYQIKKVLILGRQSFL